MDTSGSGTREHIVPQGSTVAGRYKLLRVLGEGGMGTVWLALDTSLDSNCAIKLIYGDNAQSAEMRRRFEREAKASAQLRGNNVVDVFDYGVWNDIPFIAMEFLEGEDLAQRLERVGRLTPAETYRIVVHVCRALSRAHARGIVHRDLKPENIFLTDMDGEEVAKVLDFGIAKNEKYSVRDNTTQLGAFLGTPHYVSPEQARGEPTDGRSDLWALAVIAFQSVTGRLPFYSESLGSLMGQILYDPIPVPSKVADGGVSRGFDIWWKRAAQRNPDERFQSAQEFGDELAAALGVGHRLTIPSLPPRGSVSPPPAEEDSDRRSEIVITNSGGQGSGDLPPIPLVPPVPLVPQRPSASHASADGSGSNPAIKQTMLGLGAADGAAAADGTGSHAALQRTRLGIGLGADSEAPTGKIGDAAAVAVSAASSSPGQADASGSNPAIDPALLANAAALRNGALGPGALKQAAVPKDLLPAPPSPPPPRGAPVDSSGARGVGLSVSAGSDDSLDVDFARSGLLRSVKALPRGQKVAVGSVGVLLVFVVAMALFSNTSESADVESGQQAVAAPLNGNGADEPGSNDNRVESAKPGAESTAADLDVNLAEQGHEARTGAERQSGSDSTKEGKPDNRGLRDVVSDELERDKSSQPAEPSLSEPAPKPPARQRQPRRSSGPPKSSTPTDKPDYGI